MPTQTQDFSIPENLEKFQKGKNTKKEFVDFLKKQYENPKVIQMVVNDVINKIRRWPSSKSFWIEKTMLRINLQNPDWVKRDFG